MAANTQAWISGENGQGSGIFMFRNVATRPCACDVVGKQHEQRNR